MHISKNVICGHCVHQEVCRYSDRVVAEQIKIDSLKILIEKGLAPAVAMETFKKNGFGTCSYFCEKV